MDWKQKLLHSDAARENPALAKALLQEVEKEDEKSSHPNPAAGVHSAADSSLDKCPAKRA